jgi:hypothetical protein
LLPCSHFESDGGAAERLPAQALDDAVNRSLLSAYEDTDLFSKAMSEAQERADLDESHHDGERPLPTCHLASTTNLALAAYSRGWSVPGRLIRVPTRTRRTWVASGTILGKILEELSIWRSPVRRNAEGWEGPALPTEESRCRDIFR